MPGHNEGGAARRSMSTMGVANKVGMTWTWPRRRGALFLMLLIAAYSAANLLMSGAPENGGVKEEQYHRELLQTLEEDYQLDEILSDKKRDEAPSAEYDPASMDSSRGPPDVSAYDLIDAINESRAYSGAFSGESLLLSVSCAVVLARIYITEY